MYSLFLPPCLCMPLKGWCMQIRPAKASTQFLALADACEYPVATMPNAKGMFPEEHERYLGTYWGVVSR